MKRTSFELKEEFIELNKLLKALRFAQSGALAKLMIENGEVLLNNKTELRKRAKIRSGDKITVAGTEIDIRKSR